VLALLRRYHAHATFFVIGRVAQANPHWTAAIVGDGQELGNHTWSHAPLPQLTDAVLHAELVGTSNAIAEITGARPALLRPPYGSLDAATDRAARALGLLSVTWSVDPQDYRARSARAIARSVLHAIRPGAIVLLHDGGGDRARTVAALRLILPALERRGYRLVTVTQLLNDSPPGARALLARE
jgi:peptidoglycan/xylan/chitin deacetylase (PgdA/CDA1 family)